MPAPLHEWNLAPKDAMALQTKLAKRLEFNDRIEPVRHIAGVDIGFEDGGETTRAAVVVLQWSQEAAPNLTVVEQVIHREPTRMPY
ncbi:MAG: endonuclease V, partial [Halomonas sp.]|nr:endonuclease V [Halomonas sp.]